MATVRERTREQAENVLSREYEELRAGTIRALRGKLATSGARFDDADLDAFYNQAWHGLYVRLAEGEVIENHAGFLVNAAYFRAIEELRRVRPDRRAESVDLALLGTETDVDARLDDHAQLRQLMEGMRDRLTERERQAAVLCYIHGCTRPQTAEALGVSPKRMEKLMDGVSRKIGSLVADIRDGAWCESRDSLMKAYAFGVLDPDGERWQLASAHLRECPGCRRYVRGLRGMGAIAPPIGLPLAALALIGGGAGGGAAAAGAGSQGAGTGGSGSGAAGGAGTGAGAGGAGIGVAGAAIAATAVVAAAGLGVFALTNGDDDTQPARTPAPPAAATSSPAGGSAPASTTQAAAAAAAKAKSSAKSKPSSSSQAGGGAAPSSAGAAASAPAAAPQTAPASQTAPQATSPQTTSAPQSTSTPQTAPASAPGSQESSDEPTTDAAQEFGFER